METKSYNVYKYSELSDDAKESAIEQFRTDMDYPWNTENVATLDAFCDIFGITCNDWSYGGCNSYINANTMPGFDYSEVEEFTGIRLLKYIYNNYYSDLVSAKQYWATFKEGKIEHKNCVGTNSKHRKSKISVDKYPCVFTGYCMDNEITGPIFDFLDNPCDNTTIEDLLQNCLESWVSACNSDYEACFEEDYIVDMIEANDYDFTAEGKID